MCGIIGGNNLEWNYKSALARIHHRGPDAEKLYRHNDITLGFTRLAIIDPSENGMQPMKRNSVSIVFNGEIYGYTNLKEKLKKKYKFYSESDTEVILYAYIEYGDSFIEKIDGMFAIAIYDERIRKLKLYRDRTGIKPLYYYYDGQSFAFASELKAIVAMCDNVTFEKDYTALYDYLFYQYIPEPKTMFKNCYKLPPAYMLCFDADSKCIEKINPYWKLHINGNIDSHCKKQDVREELQYLIRKSVREQLIADVPTGVFLSGGIDSSIVAFESNLAKPNIKMFTMCFDDEKYNEKKYADLMIDRYTLNCSQQYMKKEKMIDYIDLVEQWFDEPFADTSLFPSYCVSKLAKQDVTVVLSGDGSDELFGGYERYSVFSQDMRNKKSEIPVPSIIKKYSYLTENRIYREYIQDSISLYEKHMFLTTGIKAEKFKKRWNIDKDYDVSWFLKQFYKKDLPIMTRVRYLDFKTYLPGDVLTKMDRVSMANSLEVRVPFLSKDVVEFAFSLPQSDVCEPNNLKKILKETYNDFIPKGILYRRKKGFSIPKSYFYVNYGSNSVTDTLLKKGWGIYA